MKIIAVMIRPTIGSASGKLEVRPTAPQFFVRMAATKLNNPFGTQDRDDLTVIRSPRYRAMLEHYWTLVTETGEPRFDELTLQFRA